MYAICAGCSERVFHPRTGSQLVSLLLASSIKIVQSETGGGYLGSVIRIGNAI